MALLGWYVKCFGCWPGAFKGKFGPKLGHPTLRWHAPESPSLLSLVACLWFHDSGDQASVACSRCHAMALFACLCSSWQLAFGCMTVLPDVFAHGQIMSLLALRLWSSGCGHMPFGGVITGVIS
eukprot:94708-Chlamydomonas_euryale.AAC.1